MKAEELQVHLDAGRAAVMALEGQLTARLEKVLNRHADIAARNFKMRSVTLTAAGADWAQPNIDELVDTDALQADLMAAMDDMTRDGVDAFGAELPSCIVPALSNASQAAGVASPHITELLNKGIADDQAEIVKLDKEWAEHQEYDTLSDFGAAWNREKRAYLESRIRDAKAGFVGDGQASEVLDETFAGYQDVLTPDEQEALRSYRLEVGFTAMNDYLRDGKLPTEGAFADKAVLQKQIDMLDSAIAKAPADTEPLDLVVYRGVKDIRAVLGDNVRTGNRITEKGYTSTTTDVGVAVDYATSEQGGIVKILVPRGTKGAWMRGAGREEKMFGGGNMEYVLPRDSNYEVVSIERGRAEEGSGQPLVTLRLVEPREEPIVAARPSIGPEGGITADYQSWEGFPFDERTGQAPKPVDTPPERTASGDFILYHGTSPDSVDNILRVGLKPDDLGLVGVATEPGAASIFALMKAKAEGVTLRVTIDKDWLAKQSVTREIGGRGRDQFLVGDAKYGKFDGVPRSAIKSVEVVEYDGEPPVWQVVKRLDISPQARKEGPLPPGVDRDELRRLLNEIEEAKIDEANGATVTRRRKAMDAIRELTGMSPTAAKRALEEEQGALERSMSMLETPKPTKASTSAEKRIETLRQAYDASLSSLQGHNPAIHTLGNIDRVGKAFMEEVNARVGPLSHQIRRRQAITDILGEVRGLGPSSDMRLAVDPQEASPTVNGQMREAAESAFQLLPRDWADLLAQVTDDEKLKLIYTDRGFYMSDMNLIALSGRGVPAMKNTALHEFGHFVEDHHPGVRNSERRFYDKRTVGDHAEPLNRPGVQASTREEFLGEIVRPDRWVHRYLGKFYGGNAFELLSMGLEFLIGDDPANYYVAAKMWSEDPEYVRFVLGLMIGVA